MAGIAVFARVIEAKSFSGAARTLGTTKSAVSKQIARLETLVGTQLLRRTTRSLSPTEAGQLLYERAVAAIALCQDADRMLGALASEPHGLLRVSAPVTFGQRCVAPLVREFLGIHPNIQVQLVLLDRAVDLANEGYDIAIRLTRTLPKDAVARLLMSTSYVLCAAKGALRRNEIPRSPQDLLRLNCLRYGEGETNKQWRFEGANDKQSVSVRGNLQINNSEALRHAMLEGMGVALLPDFVVADDLRSGRAVTLLPDWTPRPPFGDKAYAVWLPHRHISPRIRLFLDFLSKGLRDSSQE